MDRLTEVITKLENLVNVNATKELPGEKTIVKTEIRNCIRELKEMQRLVNAVDEAIKNEQYMLAERNLQQLLEDIKDCQNNVKWIPVKKQYPSTSTSELKFKDKEYAYCDSDPVWVTTMDRQVYRAVLRDIYQADDILKSGGRPEGKPVKKIWIMEDSEICCDFHDTSDDGVLAWVAAEQEPVAYQGIAE